MINRDVVENVSAFRTHCEVLDYQTERAPQFIDVTDEVSEAVRRARVSNGIVVVFSRHTTAAIKINESEPELLKDMARFLNDIAPVEHDYYHNDFEVRTEHMEEDEFPNAHSHCQHLMLSASESVPVVNGRILLGRWQRLFLIELDRPRARQVTVQVMGT